MRLLVYLCVLAIATDLVVGGPLFVRGDALSDGQLTLGDPVCIVNHLFLGSDCLTCTDAGDVDDNGTIELPDALYLLNYLYLPLSSMPPPPFPRCGSDLTPDSQTCLSSACPEPAQGLTMVMFDVANQAAAVGSCFEGLPPKEFEVTTAAGTQRVTEYVVPILHFPINNSLDQMTFLNAGADNTPETSDPNQPVGDDISIQPPGGNDTFAAQFTGFLFVPQGGEVTFEVFYDDSVEVIIDREIVFSDIGICICTENFKVNLPPGYLPLSVKYGEHTIRAILRLSASGGGFTGGPIGPEHFFIAIP